MTLTSLGGGVATLQTYMYTGIKSKLKGFVAVEMFGDQKDFSNTNLLQVGHALSTNKTE